MSGLVRVVCPPWCNDHYAFEAFAAEAAGEHQDKARVSMASVDGGPAQTVKVRRVQFENDTSADPQAIVLTSKATDRRLEFDDRQAEHLAYNLLEAVLSMRAG